MSEEPRIGITGMEMKKYRLVQEFIDKKLTQSEVAERLGISSRQVRRLARKIEGDGLKGVIHGLAGRPSNHRLNTVIRSKVLTLWNERYRSAGFNVTHFTEKLRDCENLVISKETVRTLLRSAGVADRPEKRGRKHRRKRPRRERFGELIQLDTSPHDWLGTGIEYHAVVAVDDATSNVLFLKLFEHDGTIPNMEALHSIIFKYGRPLSLYTDGAAWFTVTRHWEGTINRRSGTLDQYCTQFERAMECLGIELIIAGSPQAKGRVERKNGVLQDRLIPELKLRGITNLEDANRYIQAEFITGHNLRFGVAASAPESAFLPFIPKEKLTEILGIKFTSTVMNDNTVSRSNRYQLQLLPTAQRLSWVKSKVEVTIKLDGKTLVRHLGSLVEIPHQVLKLELPNEMKHPKNQNYEPDILILPKADISI